MFNFLVAGSTSPAELPLCVCVSRHRPWGHQGEFPKVATSGEALLSETFNLAVWISSIISQPIFGSCCCALCTVTEVGRTSECRGQPGTELETPRTG